MQGTNINVMFIVITITVGMFVFIQSFVCPFKKEFRDVLDLSFMINYLLLVTLGRSHRIYVLMTALTTALIVIGHVFASSETCQLKCGSMRLQYRRTEYNQYHEMMQDGDEYTDLFAAEEEETMCT